MKDFKFLSKNKIYSAAVCGSTYNFVTTSTPMLVYRTEPNELMARVADASTELRDRIVALEEEVSRLSEDLRNQLSP